jgi:hypothetical protein
MDQTEFQPLLQADEILRADGVRVPKGFIEVFAVPLAEFGGTVVDEVERPRVSITRSIWRNSPTSPRAYKGTLTSVRTENPNSSG